MAASAAALGAPLSAVELVGAGSTVFVAAVIVFLADRARKGIHALREADRQKNRFMSVLARELARIHGGSVCARSPGRGMGAQFVVRLPLQKDAFSHRGAGGTQRNRAPGSAPE